jgi:hypothetical protein
MNHFIKKGIIISLILFVVPGVLFPLFIFPAAGYLSSLSAIGGYGLSACCALIWLDKNKYRFLSHMGVTFSIGGLIAAFILIWDLFPSIEFDERQRLFEITTILAVTMTHSSLLLLTQGSNRSVDLVARTSVLFGWTFSLFLTLLIYFDPVSFGPAEYGFTLRILLFLAGGTVIGTAFTFILYILTKHRGQMTI